MDQTSGHSRDVDNGRQDNKEEFSVLEDQLWIPSCNALHIALQKNDHSLVQAVLDIGDSALLEKVLSEETEERADLRTVIHQAIAHRSPFTSRIIQASNRRLFTRLDERGNTPLHLAIERFHVDEGESRTRIVIKPKSSSEHIRQFRTQKSAMGKVMDSLQSSKITAIFSSYDIIRQLIDAEPVALRMKNYASYTPYQLRLRYLIQLTQSNVFNSIQSSSLDGKEDEDSAKVKGFSLREVIMKDLVASFIRHFCARNMSSEDMIAALYRSSQELSVEFDLTEISISQSISQYLQQLDRNISFEHVLKYVALPNIRFQREVGEQHRERWRSRSACFTIFNWLRQKGVHKIISIIVADEEDPPHSDELIENTMAGFEVEMWDWQRQDIPSHVIWSSTSIVREIDLYFSGQLAVLDEWCSADGFGDSTKFPELRRVRIHIREGNRNARALEEQCIKTFSTMNAERTVKSGREVSVSISGRQPVISEHTWITTVTDFANLLMTMPSAKVPVIKIALIDDGVDVTQSSVSGKIEKGRSFWEASFSYSGGRSYFISAGGHGTRMAALICQVCPMARLWVAKVEERTINNTRSFNMKEVAKAIDWAVDSQVDIICMGWFVREDSKQLSMAVQYAKYSQTAIFCAGPDLSAIYKTYPNSYPECISISAGDPYSGQPSQGSTDGIDFRFPGQNVVSLLDNEELVVPGSAIATALACGFAGLLLYCKRLMHPEDDTGFARLKYNMREAFKSLERGDEYMDAGKIFRQVLKKKGNPDGLRQELFSLLEESESAIQSLPRRNK